MPNDIQSVRYELPMQAPRGFMDYAADATQAYYKKKKEVEDAKRAEMLAVAPTMLANNYLEPDPKGNFTVAGQNYKVVKPKEKVDYGNLNSQALWMRRTGQLPMSNEEAMSNAQFTVNTNPEMSQAYMESGDPVGYMTNLSKMYQQIDSNLRGAGSSEKMVVIDRKSGKPGEIPVSEWDETKYTRVGCPAKAGQFAPVTSEAKKPAGEEELRQRYLESKKNYTESKKAFSNVAKKNSAEVYKQWKKDGLERRKAQLQKLLTPGKENTFTDGWMIREIADIDRMLLQGDY